ncbi:DUF192 domain-containing protein [Candidatus Woesearchaeota archaeon]|nr:DUF192 domain-containing protein [Candidatus Woesearchaeota archaeon]
MIKNITKKTGLVTYYIYCISNLSKATGLMFRKKLKGNGLIFVFKHEKITPLHMIFVFFPIDVVFLDKNKRVVEIKERFKPFSFYNPKNKAMFILELPVNVIKNSKTEIGDQLDF